MFFICDEEVQVDHFYLENEDLFQTIENNVEACAQFVAWELDTFQWYHIDVDRCKAHYLGGVHRNTIFLPWLCWHDKSLGFM